MDEYTTEDKNLTDILRDSKGRFIKMAGVKLSEETKLKISEAKKGEKCYWYGKTFTEEHRQKMGKARKGIFVGRVFSDESKYKMSIAKKGKPSPKRGTKLSQQQIDKMRQLFTGRKRAAFSEQHKERIRLARLGTKRSLETRAKLVIARAKKKIPYTDTDIERKMQKALAYESIVFQTHKIMKIRNSFHAVDIFIEPNICIECDGNYWHSKLVNIKRDYIIDYELEKQGMKVIRLWETDINKNIDWCLEQIKKKIK